MKTYLKRSLKFKQIFNKDAKLPKTKEECEEWFLGLSSKLSPENLSCDGELSRDEINKKYNDIMCEWEELESIYGRQVDPDEVEQWELDRILGRK